MLSRFVHAAIIAFLFTTLLMFLSTPGFAEDAKKPKTLAEQNAEYEKLKDYCAKYPKAVECKTYQVQKEVNGLQKARDEKMEQKLKELEN